MKKERSIGMSQKIASAALCSELPFGWCSASGSHGTYYYSPSLGARQYEHPAFCYWRAVAQFLTRDDAPEQ